MVQTGLTQKPYKKWPLGRWITARGNLISSKIDTQLIKVYYLPEARDVDTGQILTPKISIERRLLIFNRNDAGEQVKEPTKPISFRTANPEDIEKLIDQLTRALQLLRKSRNGGRE